MKKLIFTILAVVVTMVARAGVLTPASVSLKDGDALEKFKEVVFDFGQSVTVDHSNIKIHKGSATGTALEVYWYKTFSGTSVKLWSGDEYGEGYTEDIVLTAGEDYYLVVPAGAFKNSAGDTNEAMTIHFTGKAAPLAYSSTSPVNNSEATQFSSLDVYFTESVTISADAKMTKGSEDGQEISLNWGHTTGSGYARFFLWDEYMEGTEPINLEAGESYYITIPAGAITGKTSGRKNDKIVIKITGKVKEFLPVSFTPSNNTIQETFSQITINFSEKVSTVSGKTPKFTKGSATGSDLADKWNSSTGQTSVTYWMEDYDGYTDIKDLEANVDYYITIPAGAIKNQAGQESKEIVVKITGKQRILSVVSTTPADGAESKTFSNLDVVFGENVTLVSGKTPKLRKGSKTGSEVTAYWGSRVSGKTLSVYSLDEYYEGAEPVALEPGTYYVVIPEGMVKNSKGAINQEIAVKIVSPAEGIELDYATPANEAEVKGRFSAIILTFKEPAYIVKKDTGAKLKDAAGKEYGDVDYWYAFSGNTAKDVKFVAQDLDLYTMEVKFVKGGTYTFTVPAGVVKNAAGGLNKEITLTFYGEKEGTGIDAVVDGKAVKAKKVVRNGRVQIVVDGNVYDTNGTEVK